MAMETSFLQQFHLFVTSDDTGRQLVLSVGVTANTVMSRV